MGAAWLLAPSLGNAFFYDVPMRLAIDLDGFATLALEREVEVEIDPGDWPYDGLVALDLGADALAGSIASVPATPLGATIWVDAETSSGAAHFAPVDGFLGGVVPLGGAAHVCLAPCEESDPLLTLPLAAIGGGASVVAPPFWFEGAAWTTGTVVAGDREATGRNLVQEPRWTDLASPWWSVSLVTPVFLVRQTGDPIAGIARLDLRSWTPQCANGQDDDGDGRTDHPDDPGCSDENDLEEGLEIYDGGEHEIDGSIVPGERLYIGGSDENPTRVRMRAPAELSEVHVHGGEFLMEGGELRGGLYVRGGRATVSGGQFGSIGVAVGGMATLQGMNFDRPMGEVSDLNGLIAGTLADGTPFDGSFWRDGEESTLVLPEPGSAACAVAVASALAACARARR